MSPCAAFAWRRSSEREKNLSRQKNIYRIKKKKGKIRRNNKKTKRGWVGVGRETVKSTRIRRTKKKKKGHGGKQKKNLITFGGAGRTKKYHSESRLLALVSLFDSL